MSSQGFSKLPTELVVLVMTHLETPRDLFASIRTWRPVPQIFQENRIAILEAVIRNAFPHENIQTAVAACSASPTSKLWWAKSSAAAVRESHDRFRKDYPRGCAPDDSSLRNSNHLLSLYKLWWISDYFLSCFEQDALGFAAGKVHLMQERRTGDIVDSERSRLQRAFLRFEIYRRITPATMDKSLSVPNAEYDRTKDFLQWFPPWEREEILSVHEFLVEFVKNASRRLGDFIILELSSMAHDMATESEAAQGIFEPEPIARIKMGLDLGGLDVFQHDFSLTERRFQYFVARGLPFIRWLANLPPRDQIEVTVHYSGGCCSFSFFEALQSWHSELTSFDAEIGWPDESHAGTLKGPNQGWTWAKTHGLTTGENSLLIRYDLRRMGYVFWDAARLRKDWRLPLISPSMLELHPREGNDADRHWREEPGIEERVKDIPIPKGAFDNFTKGPYPRLETSREMEEKIEDGYPTPFSDKEAELFDIEY